MVRPLSTFERVTIVLVFVSVAVLVYERAVRYRPETSIIPDATGVIRRAEEIARDAVGRD